MGILTNWFGGTETTLTSLSEANTKKSQPLQLGLANVNAWADVFAPTTQTTTTTTTTSTDSRQFAPVYSPTYSVIMDSPNATQTVTKKEDHALTQTPTTSVTPTVSPQTAGATVPFNFKLDNSFGILLLVGVGAYLLMTGGKKHGK